MGEFRARVLTNPRWCAIILPSKNRGRRRVARTKPIERAADGGMAVRSPREWTSEGRTIPTAWEVVPDGCAPVILRCVWMYAREAPIQREQFGWHRGFVEFVPKQGFSFVRGFLFGSEKEDRYVQIQPKRTAMVMPRPPFRRPFLSKKS